MKIFKTTLPLTLLFLLVFYTFGCNMDQPEKNRVDNHIFDKAGIISTSDKPKFEWLLDLIQKESGIDIKCLFLKTIRHTTVEEVAVNKMDEYGIGGKGKKQRGILFLFVLDKQKLRIEVGYGLEAYLPDIFVGYLIRNHADAFFEASNPSLGLRLLIRILQHRIREAALNKKYDPSILENGVKLPHLSGGAGASKKVGTDGSDQPFMDDQYDNEDKKQFVATNTVKGTFNNYIAWLYGRKFDPDVDLFTKDSIPVLNNLPMTPAYFDYILMMVVGNQHKIIKREDLAILYFTDDPLATPLFFNKIDGKWRMNIVAEIRNSQNHVGGVYSWAFNTDSKGEFTTTFNDLLVNIRGYHRFKDGDNRELPVQVDIQKNS